MADSAPVRDQPALSIVLPTLGNHDLLRRVLDGYERQQPGPEPFEVLVVADRAEPDLAAVDAAVGERPFPVRRLMGRIPGASANRNAGWQVARAPLILFTDNDTIPSPGLVSEHLSWHRRYPGEAVVITGLVRWAPDLSVTPFMRWLEHGLQFDFVSISGIEAGWAHVYSANCSIKRSFLDRVGGYDEKRLPYLYEDIDWGYRARAYGLRVLLNRSAVVDHCREMTLQLWQGRAALLAAAEWRFCALHPEVEPWFWKLFSDAAGRPPQRGRAASIAGIVPRGTPWLGPLIWNLADLYWRQQLAPHFLAAWKGLADGPDPVAQPEASTPAAGSASSDGS